MSSSTKREAEEKSYFGNKCAFRCQEVGSQLHGIDNQGVLAGGFLSPSTTNVGRTIVQHQIKGRTPLLAHYALDLGLTFGPGDVLLDGDGAANGSDGNQIDTDDKAADGDALNNDLHPTTWGGTEVEDGVGGAEEGVLGIELNQLPRGSRTVAMFFGQVVELVQTMLSLDLTHGCSLPVGSELGFRNAMFAKV